MSIVGIGNTPASGIVIGDSTYIAQQFPGVTREAKIQAAITRAKANGVKYVYVSKSLLPYDTSKITFSNAVWMICEGGRDDVFDPIAYGAAFNGSNDDTLAIQAAIDAAFFGRNPSATGFVAPVYFPAGAPKITSSLTLHTGTHILGATGEGETAFPYCRLTATRGLAVPMIEIGSSIDVIIEGFFLQGTTVAGCKGIHGTLCNGVQLRNLGLNTFGSQGVHIEGSDGGRFAHLFISNGVQAKGGLIDYAGAFDVAGEIVATDIYADCGTFATGQGIGSGYQAGIVVHSVGGEFVSCQGDGAQTGFVVAADANLNSFIGCRGNLAQGDTWRVIGHDNRFIGCRAHDASLNANNAADGFAVSGLGNQFIGNVIGANVVGRVRNGFTDTTAPNDVENSHNYYIGNKLFGTGVAGSLYKPTGNAGSYLHPRRGINRDKGDANVTVTLGVDSETIWFNTPLTTNRTCTLAGRFNGARVRVVRGPGATGASTLTVQFLNGGNKVLAVGQWCEVEYSGRQVGYMLIGAGTL